MISGHVSAADTVKYFLFNPRPGPSTAPRVRSESSFSRAADEHLQPLQAGWAGWRPDANSINAPDGTLLRADNMVPDEDGALSVRRGTRVLYTFPLGTEDIRSLYTYEGSDGYTYRLMQADDQCTWTRIPEPYGSLGGQDSRGRVPRGAPSAQLYGGVLGEVIRLDGGRGASSVYGDLGRRLHRDASHDSRARQLECDVHRDGDIAFGTIISRHSWPGDHGQEV